MRALLQLLINESRVRTICVNLNIRQVHLALDRHSSVDYHIPPSRNVCRNDQLLSGLHIQFALQGMEQDRVASVLSQHQLLKRIRAVEPAHRNQGVAKH